MRGGRQPNAGRPPGRRNKSTIEALERERIFEQMMAARPPGVTPEQAAAAVGRAPAAEKAVARAEAVGRKLAKERLEELMEIFIGATAYHQPTLSPAGQHNVNADWDKFERWGRLAMDCAAKLAPYQSPTFRAVVVSSPGDMAGAARPTQIDGDNVIHLNDPVAASRVYQRIVGATKRG